MTSHLQHTSIQYYRRYYSLIVIAIIVMMTVLTGSVVTGDSVRGTLTDRVEERLAGTETLITSGTGFLSEDILRADSAMMQDAKVYLLMDGFVSVDDKMLPVFVWGCDDDKLQNGEVFINESLAQRLTEQDIVLHLPSHSLVPSGTLFVTQAYSTQMRLHVKDVKSNEQGGNLLLHNEQTRPLNVFMRRVELADKMEMPGKINLIMSPRHIEENDFKRIWQPCHSGIKLDGHAITADRIFLPATVVDTLLPDRILNAYLVNNIYTADADTTTDVPYSFVTAASRFADMTLSGDDVVLSDYTAQRMHVGVGDSVSMEYFITHNLKRLHTCTHSFCVKAVLPLETFLADTLLTAEFPGLSHVERCTDWDSDLPIQMEHIGKQDEDYWHHYKQTPKAVVAYDAVHADWSTPFGVATAITISDTEKFKQSVQPHMMGVVVIHPREAGLYAAQHGTDFSGLFLALGFFIILAAILLMQSPLVEMLNQRKDEIKLYAQLGYTRRRIHIILLGEQLRVLPLATLVGTVSGILYAALMLFLLGNVWSGATHTEGFALHLNPLSILLCYIMGLLICLLTAWYSIHCFLKERKARIASQRSPYLLYIYMLALGATLALFVGNLLMWRSLLMFVACGMLWLVFTALLVMHIIARRAVGEQGLLRKEHTVSRNVSFSRSAMLWKSIHASRSQWLLSYWSLSVGVFTVLSVGLNRPDFSHTAQNEQLTFGCQLWCDLRVPMEYDLNNSDVRRKLSLTDLPDSTYFIQCLRHTEDEASCLNLNRVSTPTVIAFAESDTSMVRDFSFNRSGLLLDEESLLWSVMKSVGDTLVYTASDGSKQALPILDSYPTGIFHGYGIMPPSLFRELWPEESGSKILLVRTPQGKEQEVASLLEVALSPYGVNVCTTTDRLLQFFTVTETYLIIFLILGGLGMLVGIFSLIITLRKTLVSRHQQTTTLRALGYDAKTVRALLFRECFIIPVCAIVLGAIGSLVSISANVGGVGWGTWLLACLFLVLLFGFVYIGIKRIIIKTV